MAAPHSGDVLAGDRVACADRVCNLALGGRNIEIGAHRRAAEIRLSRRGHVGVRVAMFVHVRIFSGGPDSRPGNALAQRTQRCCGVLTAGRGQEDPAGVSGLLRDLSTRMADRGARR